MKCDECGHEVILSEEEGVMYCQGCGKKFDIEEMTHRRVNDE